MIALDETVFRWLNDLAGRDGTLDAVIRLLISDYLLPMLATLAVAGLWFAGRNAAETRRYQHAALQALLALGTCQLVVALTNIAIGRPRPFAALDDVTVLFYEPINSSFPAHPVATVVAIGIVILGVHRPLGWAVITLGLVLGLGRIIAGLWFPTDVLGGIAAGWLSVIVARLILGKLSRTEAFIRRKAADLNLG